MGNRPNQTDLAEALAIGRTLDQHNATLLQSHCCRSISGSWGPKIYFQRIFNHQHAFPSLLLRRTQSTQTPRGYVSMFSFSLNQVDEARRPTPWWLDRLALTASLASQRQASQHGLMTRPNQVHDPCDMANSDFGHWSQ